MAWEFVGNVGGEHASDESWTLCQLELALVYLRHVCGEPSDPMKLGIGWDETDYGSAPFVGVWEGLHDGGEYRSRCEIALQTFSDAVSWPNLSPTAVRKKWEK